MNRMRTCYVAALLALLAGPSGLSAQSPLNADFSTASLVGTYAAQEQGDGSVSAGLGVVHYDGKGKTTRRITVNAPDGTGGRRILVFESEGEYTVNADGSGKATYANVISEDTVTTVTVDFVITEATSTFIPGRRPARIANEVFAVQREAGVTVSLVTSLQKRIAEQ